MKGSKTAIKEYMRLSFECLILYTALMFIFATIAFPEQMADDSWIPEHRMKSAIHALAFMNPF